jgi:hypothetical protein
MAGRYRPGLRPIVQGSFDLSRWRPVRPKNSPAPTNNPDAIEVWIQRVESRKGLCHPCMHAGLS